MGVTYLFLGIISAIIFNPFVWIVVVVVLIARHNDKKKKARAAELAAQNPDGKKDEVVTPPPKPANPMAKWNWLLYIGSFLIVLAMIYFIDSVNDSFVAPSTIAMTIIIYLIGVTIHRKIDYLRPVSKAFTYSALCMIPLWLISFNSIGLPDKVIPICVSTAFVLAAFAGTYLLEDKVMAYFAYISVAPLIWSIYPLLDLKRDGGIYYYFVYLSPMIAGLLPMTLHLNKPKWLPEAFKSGAKILGTFTIPIVYCLSLLLFASEDIYKVAPYLRISCAVLFLTYASLSWLRNKTHGFLIIFRFSIQALAMALTLDLLKFPITGSTQTFDAATTTVALICAIVWLLGFTAQILRALYSKKQSASDTNLENAVSIASIACIFLTPMYCQGFSSVGYAAVWLVICLIVAGLGIVHAIHHKNVTWSIATAISIMAIPLIFGVYIAAPKWDGYAYLVCYTVIAAVFLTGTYMLRAVQKKEANLIGAISVTAACFAVLTASGAESIGYIGYLITTIFLAAFALVSRVNAFYEVAAYSFALFLMTLTSVTMKGSVYGTTRQFIYAHLAGGALLLTNYATKYLYPKQKPSKVRFVIGYSLFSVFMTIICLSTSYRDSEVGWSLLFLLEQAAALLYAVFKKENWLIWFSSIEIFLIAFRLTNGMSYLWLGIIGVGLIAVVIWQLSKANKNRIASDTTPPIPEVKAIEEPKKTKSETEKANEESKSDKESKGSTDDSKEPKD